MWVRSNLRAILACEPVGLGPERAHDETPGAPRAPQCPNCRITTLWYQSRLQRQNGSSKIVHSYHCPNCARVMTTEEPAKHGRRVI